MENNISEKYAVYTVGADGKNVLSVVVDSHDEAKKELEKLKSGTDCIKINRCKVENFAKEGEKITESVEVECWKKENEPSPDKLSNFQKSAEVLSVAPIENNNLGAGGSASAVNDIAKPALSIKETLKSNLESFYNYYSVDGDFIGVKYGFFPYMESVNSSGQNSVSENIGSNPLPSEADEIKKLTNEISELKSKINELISVEKEENKNESKDEDKSDDES